MAIWRVRTRSASPSCRPRSTTLLARGIWAARGGYGLTRILPDLRLRALRESPKLIIGFSDVTALHAALGALGIGSVHGPNVGQLGELTAPALERLVATVFSSLPPEPLGGATTIVPGRASGLLLGGNLTLLAALAGTPHLPSFSGAILLLEDIAERAPTGSIDLGRSCGRAGRWSGFEVSPSGTIHELRRSRRRFHRPRGVRAPGRARARLPTAFGFPVGHIDDNCAVPLGTEVELDASSGTLTFTSGLAA